MKSKSINNHTEIEIEKFKGHELFYFASCPYCIRVLIAIKIMGINIPLRNIHSSSGFKHELVQGGGKKQVPCLKVLKQQGEIIWMYESSDIIQYLKQHNG